MRNQTCCFTGHRILSKNKISVIESTLRKEVANLIDRDVKYFGVGGAIGFDTLAAQTVIDLRYDYKHIKLILIIPCKDQAERWSHKDKTTYQYIKSHADKIVYLSEKYENGCMLKRNRHMVNNSSFVIAAWDGRKRGGTYYTVNYAQKLKKEIIFINVGIKDYDAS